MYNICRFRLRVSGFSAAAVRCQREASPLCGARDGRGVSPQRLTGAPPLDPAGFCKAGETYGCSCVNELCFAQRGVNAEGIYSVRSVCIRAASSRLERRVCTPTCKPYGLPHGAKRIFALCECPNVSLAFLKSAPSKVEPWSRSAEREILFNS